VGCHVYALTKIFMDIKKHLTGDLTAGLVVFLVALPLCLGIALASGAPLFSGIIAGIIGGIVVGSLSKSPVSVSGPAAGLATIVLAGIQDLGFSAFLLSVALAGIFQIALGYMRAGSVGNFFPASVIKGMLAAIGVILVLKQVPHALGYDADFEGDESFAQTDHQNTFTEILQSLGHFSAGAIIISIISISVMILWNTKKIQQQKFFKRIPGPLVIVAMGILINVFFQTFIPNLAIEEKHMVTVPIISESSSVFSFISLPDFNALGNPKIYFTALTLAVVASLETLLAIEACDKLDPYKRITPLNHELKAQGVANVLSGLLGGLPITSVIVRSSANVSAGAKSKLSAIMHGIILLLSILLVPQLLTKIPLSCLAGILIVIGFKLAQPAIFRDVYKKGISQWLPFVVTILAVIFTNLLQGVFMGLLVAIFFILKENFREAIIVVSNERNYLMRFTKDVSFLNKGTMRRFFSNIPDHSTITIDGTQAGFIDQDIREAIIDFMETSRVKNINVELKNIQYAKSE
jgi:MFS superfamily sulfate permease-like transporter